MAVRDLLAAALAPRTVESTAIALPESVNAITQFTPSARALHLPIVTTVDLPLARTGAGPDWHAYPRASADLKFIATLYDVGFGIQTRDARIRAGGDLAGKRIGAPARPSAVRLLTETLLRDGWGAETVLVDLAPGQALAALESGSVDAISWNLTLPAADGLRPMLGAHERLRYLPIEDAALARINRANPFPLSLTPATAHAPPLLSFAQALAAWDETPGDLIGAILHALAANAEIGNLARWPALTNEQIHPAARAFYIARGLTFS